MVEGKLLELAINYFSNRSNISKTFLAQTLTTVILAKWDENINRCSAILLSLPMRMDRDFERRSITSALSESIQLRKNDYGYILCSNHIYILRDSRSRRVANLFEFEQSMRTFSCCKQNWKFLKQEWESFWTFYWFCFFRTRSESGC